MKLLYLSCHSILEYDELKLFHEIGIEYFSLGSYLNPQNPVDKKRPPIDGTYNDHLIVVAGRYSRDRLHPELVDPFDAVMVMHIPEWIENNWEIMKHKPIIWRSIGQSTPWIENRIMPFRKKGLKIVRYSPKESTIKGYAGDDALIRFYKDHYEYGNWTGENKEVVTIAQSMKKRDKACYFSVFKKVTNGLPAKVYGSDNDDAGELNGGQLDYQELKSLLRRSRVYVYTGTNPASYVLNFIEAWMTGIPVVALGPRWGNSKDFPEQKTYEVHELIQNGVNGFWSDDEIELRKYIEMLLADHELAKRIGAAGRESAIRHFGKDLIKSAWKSFFEKL